MSFLWLSFSAVSFVLMIAANGSWGKDIGKIAQERQFFLGPASYAFSIWGLIYLGICAALIFILTELLSAKKKNESEHLNSEGVEPVLPNLFYILFIASCAFNIAWVYTWTKTGNIFGPAIVLTMLTACVAAATHQILFKSPHLSHSIVVAAPLSIYAAWTTVASLLNWILSLFPTEDGRTDAGGALFSAFLTIIFLAFVVLAFKAPVDVVKRSLIFALLTFLWVLAAVQVRISQENSRGLWRAIAGGVAVPVLFALVVCIARLVKWNE